MHSLHFDTLTAHSGDVPADASGSIVPPIVLATTFAQSDAQHPAEFVYSRTHNPTRHRAELALAALEGAKDCRSLAFATGMAAIDCVVQVLATLHTGSRIVCMSEAYGGLIRYLQHVAAHRFAVTFADLSDETTWPLFDDLDDIGAVWYESCSNPLLKVVDATRLHDYIRSRRQKSAITIVIDNTFITPMFFRPLASGVCDVVVHSATKYINGHCDVLAGVVSTCRDDLHTRFAFHQNATGATLSAFDAYLLMRGMKTLAVRMRQHHANAQAVAAFLQTHKRITRLFYAGARDSASGRICDAQFGGFGGAVVSFEAALRVDELRTFLARLRIFTLAESLGGVESLVEVPAFMTHASLSADELNALQISPQIVRLSVGIEAAEDLVADLQQAFDAVS